MVLSSSTVIQNVFLLFLLSIVGMPKTCDTIHIYMHSSRFYEFLMFYQKSYGAYTYIPCKKETLFWLDVDKFGVNQILYNWCWEVFCTDQFLAPFSSPPTLPMPGTTGHIHTTIPPSPLWLGAMLCSQHCKLQKYF